MLPREPQRTNTSVFDRGVDCHELQLNRSGHIRADRTVTQSKFEIAATLPVESIVPRCHPATSASS